ncbi:gypsy retrotransposon integrase-like protein, partial [Trifolium medium]|nr:gypsy retrotransposon integrase-like protein [Trifolium medium]
LKYLIVAVDYCTKWIEVEALASITAANVIKFFKRNALTMFGIPQSVLTDNGTQLTDKKMQNLLLFHK